MTQATTMVKASVLVDDDIFSEFVNWNSDLWQSGSEPLVSASEDRSNIDIFSVPDLLSFPDFTGIQIPVEYPDLQFCADLPISIPGITAHGSAHLPVSVFGCEAHIPRQRIEDSPEQGDRALPPCLVSGHTSSSRSYNSTLQQFLHEFEAEPGKLTPKRKRKQFSPDRRGQVGQLRKAGACLRCRITKTACQLNLPCSSCVKLCGSSTLGTAICTGHDLIKERFALDLWNRDADVLWLAQTVIACDSPIRTVQVLLDARIEPGTHYQSSDEKSSHWDIYPSHMRADVKRLELKVRHFSPAPDFQPSRIDAQNTIPGGSYAMPLDLVPGLEQIESWAAVVYKSSLRNDKLHPSLGFFRSAFVNFAEAYHVSKKNLPHKDLVHKAVRLTFLHGVWRRTLVEDSHTVEQVSEAVHIQLATIITEGITNLELDILSALQKHVLGSKGPGKDNMLPIWTCLWLLILTYRETIDAWSAPEHEKKGLPQLARHMYDMLVALYSGLFRPSSPLRLNWIFDDIYRLFGRDSGLMRSIGTIKTEFTQFSQPHCYPFWHGKLVNQTLTDKFGGHNHQKDVLMRKLIFEREIKGMRAWKGDELSRSHYESSKIYFPLRTNVFSYPDPSVAEPEVSFIQLNQVTG